MNAFEELAEAQRAMKKKIEEEGQDILKGYFKDIFEDLPDLKCVAWQQYVPSFNDGDPCVFSIAEIRFEIEGLRNKYYQEDDDEEDDDYYDLESNPRFVDSYDLYKNLDWVNTKPTEVLENQLVVKGDGYNSNRWKVYTDVHPYFERVNKMISDLNENEVILQYAFGDNARVTVNREDITVEETEYGY